MTRKYLEPYQRSVEMHGSTFEATLWASPRSQVRRFEVFTQMCHLAGRRILDVGCSRGDLAAFLLEHQVAFDRYIGVDALPEVVEFAASRGLARCEFHCGDVLQEPRWLSTGEPDVICISGTLNTMSCGDALRLLEAAWAAVGHALLFNFLSDRASPEAPPQDGPAYRLPVLKLLDWAMSRTSQVAMRQDYFKHGHDATIYMRKPQEH